MRFKILIGLFAWLLWLVAAEAIPAMQELSDEELDGVTAGVTEVAGIDGVLRFDMNDDNDFHRDPRLNVSIEGKAAVALDMGQAPEQVWTLALRETTQPGRQSMMDLNATNFFFPFLGGGGGGSNAGLGLFPSLFGDF
jgi:hypothetical protein